MRAVVLDGAGQVQLAELPEPPVGPEDVLIAPGAVGICGTDLHLVEGSYATGRYPVVPGHEFAGVVTAVGRDVRGLTEGDLVGVDPNVNDGTCRWCRTGAPNLCPALEPVGVTRDGACAGLVAVPARVTYRLPSGIDATVGALVEPLACVLHALDRGPDLTDRDVLIYGGGSIGLVAAILAVARKAGRIQVVEPHAVRRRAALRLGAHAAAASSAELDLPDGAETVIEASGHPAAIADALDRLAIRGTLVQMGVTSPQTRVPLPTFEVFEKELEIIGSNSLADAYPAAVELVPDLADTLRTLVTHVRPLAQYRQALEAAASPQALKVHVDPAR